MYTEIRELVNYIVSHLFNKIPRRKVITFAEQLANRILCRIRNNWDNGDEMSKVVWLRLRVAKDGGVKEQTDDDVIAAAKDAATDVEELTKLLPEGISIHIGPGEVIYHMTDSSNKASSVHEIWRGSRDCDEEYSPLPASLSISAEETGEASVAQSGNYVQLNLVKASDENGSTTVFAAFSGHPNEYPVKQFSATRFGSHRARPDHEMMKRIQTQAAFESFFKPTSVDNSWLSSTSTPFVPTPEASSPLDIIKSMNADQREMLVNLLSSALTGNENVDGIISALSECSMRSFDYPKSFQH